MTPETSSTAEKRVLHLTLKKKWFDMIASGEKKEEYREIKDYWLKRFKGKSFYYDLVEFRNGYGKNAPRCLVQCLSIEPHTGYPAWGAFEGKTYFVIYLGKILTPSKC